MRLSHIGICVLGLGLTVVATQGCGSSDDTKGSGGGTGGTAGSTSGGAGMSGGTSGGAGAGGTMAGGGGSRGGAAGGSGGAGGSASTAGKTTYVDVKPVFMAKCTPCHMMGGSGAIFHTLATSYDDAQKAASSCMPMKKKGECTIDRIKSGGMPFGKGCKGMPAVDKDNPACLTQAEIDRIDAWVKDGILEK